MTLFGFKFVPVLDPWRVHIEFDLKDQRQVGVYLKVMKLLAEEKFIGNREE